MFVDLTAETAFTSGYGGEPPFPVRDLTAHLAAQRRGGTALLSKSPRRCALPPTTPLPVPELPHVAVDMSGDSTEVGAGVITFAGTGAPFHAGTAADPVSPPPHAKHTNSPVSACPVAT